MLIFLAPSVQRFHFHLFQNKRATRQKREGFSTGKELDPSFMNDVRNGDSKSGVGQSAELVESNMYTSKLEMNIFGKVTKNTLGRYKIKIPMTYRYRILITAIGIQLFIDFKSLRLHRWIACVPTISLVKAKNPFEF